MIIIQVALSKEQIDAVIGRSREIKHMTESRFPRAQIRRSAGADCLLSSL